MAPPARVPRPSYFEWQFPSTGQGVFVRSTARLQPRQHSAELMFQPADSHAHTYSKVITIETTRERVDDISFFTIVQVQFVFVN